MSDTVRHFSKRLFERLEKRINNILKKLILTINKEKFIMNTKKEKAKPKALTKAQVVELVYKTDKDFIDTDIDRVRIKTLKLILDKLS